MNWLAVEGLGGGRSVTDPCRSTRSSVADIAKPELLGPVRLSGPSRDRNFVARHDGAQKDSDREIAERPAEYVIATFVLFESFGIHSDRVTSARSSDHGVRDHGVRDPGARKAEWLQLSTPAEVLPGAPSPTRTAQ